MGPQQSPNNKELILIALTEGGSMPSGKIREWLTANNYRGLTAQQASGAIDALLKEGKVTAKKLPPSRGRGQRGRRGRLYSVATGNELRGADFTDLKTPKPSERSFESAFEALIPCYGMNWLRDQVEWDKRPPELLGSLERDGRSNTRVNFAEQFGVYVLYEWPNVTYVGRTTEGRLYDRLLSHTKDNRRGWWDRFAWFGLRSVGANQKLVFPHEHLDMEEAITAMEAILIEILSPPFNNKSGDRLGPRYSQVPVVDERRTDQFTAALAEVTTVASYRR